MHCSCFAHDGFLTAAGYAAVAQRDVDIPEGVDMEGDLWYLDKVRSVSGLRRDETMLVFDDELIDNQYRRFLNGS